MMTISSRDTRTCLHGRRPVLCVGGLWIGLALLCGGSPLAANDGPLSPGITAPPGLHSGDWADSVALELPKGPNGFAPQLAIVHAKDMPDGPLGRGYMLATGGIISRRSAGGGLPGYASAAEYRLDGTPLIPMAGGRGEVKRFSAESDEGSEILYESGSNRWRVRRDGWTWTYGAADRGAVKRATPPAAAGRTGDFFDNGVELPGACGHGATAADCDVVAWYLTDVTDPYGHSLRYTYEVAARPPAVAARYGTGSTAEHLVSKMVWSRPNGERVGTVEFEYSDRPDPQVGFAAGTATFMTRRLSGIEVYFRDQLYTAYRLTYRDESDRDCSGEPYTAPSPRTLLRSIERLGIEAKVARRLRCVEMHEQPLAIGDWTQEVVARGVALDYNDQNILLPVNLDGDGMTDLILLRPESSHQTLVATGGSQTPFRHDESRRGVRSWQDLLDGIMFGDFFSSGRGWTITDLTGDGFPDLLYERQGTGGGPGAVELRPYRPETDLFPVVPLTLDACQLRFATVADVDGDGFADLVETAHEATDDCPRRNRSRWLRNSGESPYFDPGTGGEGWWALDMPFSESQLIDMAGSTLRVDGVAVEPPFGAQVWQDPRAFVSRQARFSDYNGDGISDVSYAFFRQWRLLKNEEEECDDPTPRAGEDEGECQWRPLPDSAYSEIFWGTGYGDFRASGLAAGEPTLNSSASPDPTGTAVSRAAFYRVTYANLQDLDGSGVAELLASNSYRTAEPAVRAFRYTDLLDGYGARTEEAGGILDTLPLARLPLSDLPHEPSACCTSQARPVFGDFDGNGFPDILELRYDSSDLDGVCQGRKACVTIRYSRRETAEARVVASTNSWGGVTELEWGYTGQDVLAGHEGMVSSVEVLKAKDGAAGRESYSYRLGVGRGREFAGFALVERGSARGMVDRFVTALTPALHGKLLAAARFGPAGTLEKLVVQAYGRYTVDGGGPPEYTIDVAPPYVNPRIRECVYEVETPADGSTQALAGLVRDCWGWGGRNAPSHAQLQAASGMKRYVFNLEQTLAASVWGEVTAPGARGRLRALLGDRGADLWGVDRIGGVTALGFRWSRPRGLPPAPSIEALMSAVPSAARGTGFKRYVTDFTVDEALLRAAEIVRHRDTDTTGDDLRDKLEWKSVAGTRGARLLERRRLDGAGDLLSSWQADRFAGFDDALTVTTCGRDGRGCREVRRVYDKDGLLNRRQRVEAEAEESWDREWCVRESYTDPAGRRREIDFDRYCRRQRVEWRGVVTTRQYDGLHRVRDESVLPAGAEVADRRQIFQDDRLEIGEDHRFAEPRMATLSFGRLDLRYFDGFGRLTRRVTCAAGRVETGADGNLTASCRRGTQRVREWNLYGEDGRRMAVAEGFHPGREKPRFTYVPLRDAVGERLVMLEPPHAAPGGSGDWRRTATWRAPGRLVTQDPLGRIAVSRHTTLGSTERKSGQLISETKLDAQGRTVSTFDVDEGRFTYRYDELSREIERARTGRAKTLDAKGGELLERAWVQRQEHNQRDQVTRLVNPDGTERRRTYDVLNRPLRTTWADPRTGGETTSSQSYEVTGQGLERVTTVDAQGAVWVEELDGLGRRLVEYRPSGVETRWTYRPDRRQIQVARRDGSLRLTGEREFDLYGDLVRVEGFRGDVAKFEYAGNGDPLRQFLPTGATLENDYLRSGKLSQRRLRGDAGSWLLESFRYDAASRPIAVVADGLEIAYRYDDLDRPEVVERGRGSEALASSTLYEGASSRPRRVTRQVSGLDPVTAVFSYDSWHRLQTLDPPGPGSQGFVYDLAGRTRRRVDETGYTLQTDYDHLGRPTRRQVPGGGEVRYRYETAPSYAYRSVPGRSVSAVLRTRVDDGVGESREWRDAEGRLLAVRRPAGDTVEYLYDGSRLVDEYQIGAGGGGVETRKHYAYDGRGRPVAVHGPAAPEAFPSGPIGRSNFDGYSTRFQYGPGGQVRRIDAAGEVTELDYDPSSGLLMAERFGAQSVRRVYSPADGRLAPRVVAEETVGAGGAMRKRAFDYDSLGRVVEETVSDGRSRVVNLRKGFDTYGNPRTETRLSGSDGGRLAEEVAYRNRFDERGWLRSREVSIGGQPVGAEAWEYFDNGVLRGETTLFGDRFVHEYGAQFDYTLDRIVRQSDRQVVAALLARDAAGRATEVRTANGATTTTFAPDGRIELTRVTDPRGGLVSSWDPEYDARRRVASEAFAHRGASWSKEYGYSPEGFLVREGVQGAGVRGDFRYRLGTAGQRLETVLDGRSLTAVAYTSSGLGQRVATVNGGKIGYDAWEGVVLDQHGTELRRSGDGQIAEVRRGGRGWTLLRDAAGVPRAAVDQQGRRQLLSYGSGGLSRPLAVERFDGTRETFLTAEGRLLDRLESRPAASPPLLDAGRSILADSPRGKPLLMTAFGSPLSDGGSSSFAYAGLERVEFAPGLHLARHRGYDAETGRFLSPDPVRLLGGAHRTLYAAGDPVQFADPLGFWACPVQVGANPNLDSGIPPIDLGMEYDRSPPIMAGTGNTQYDMAQRELAAGLEEADFYLGTPEGYSISEMPGECQTYCPSTGDPNPGGLPGDDVDAQGMGSPRTGEPKGDSGSSGGTGTGTDTGASTEGKKKEVKKKPSEGGGDAVWELFSDLFNFANVFESLESFWDSLWNGSSSSSSGDSAGERPEKWDITYDEQGNPMWRGVRVGDSPYSGGRPAVNPVLGDGTGGPSPPALPDLPVVLPFKPKMGPKAWGRRRARSPAMPVFEVILEGGEKGVEMFEELSYCFNPSTCDREAVKQAGEEFLQTGGDAVWHMIPGGDYLKESDPDSWQGRAIDQDTWDPE